MGLVVGEAVGATLGGLYVGSKVVVIAVGDRDGGPDGLTDGK